MELKVLENLRPEEYEHPFDRQALNALERTTGLDTLVQKIYEYGLEKVMRVQLTGSCFKVTPSSIPEVYELLEQTCAALNLSAVPELYLRRGGNVLSDTCGVDRPIVLLSTEAVQHLGPAELTFILGREIGHIKSAHVKYLDIGFILPVLSDILDAVTLGTGGLLSTGLRMALLHWIRMAEFTADRAGLLACQDVLAATSVLAKISGLPEKYYADYNLDDFVTQAREFKGFDTGNYNKFLKYATLTLGADQTWTISRANEFYQWIDAGGYQEVLERKNMRVPAAVGGAAFCTQCGNKLTAGAAFCTKCGKKV